MMTLCEFAAAFEEGEKQYEAIMSNVSSISLCNKEEYIVSGDDDHINIVARCDNLPYMEYLIKEGNMAGRIQLIYLDPPFFTKGNYQASTRIESDVLGKSGVIKVWAYDDSQREGMSRYITMMTVRLLMMRELLAETGCIWVHLDWHGVHYIKAVMDQIFGEKNFINEIIWNYKSGGSSKRSFAKKHDTLLLYSKTAQYVFNPLKEKSYNRELKPYRFKGVKEFQDEKGWHTVVNMKDVWAIDMVGRTSAERTGYATQKPERLMERIIKSCSREGDICADFFGGSGSFGVTAAKIGRKSIMCDCSNLAVADMISRFTAENIPCGVYFQEGRDKRSDSTGTVEISIEDGVLNLVKYIPQAGNLPQKDIVLIEKYIREDSLSLVKLWSIDYDYDGITHRGQSVFHRGERRILCRNVGIKGHIHIAGYDIFGNRFEGESNG